MELELAGFGIKERLKDKSYRVCVNGLYRLETCDKLSASRLSIRPNSIVDIYYLSRMWSNK